MVKSIPPLDSHHCDECGSDAFVETIESKACGDCGLVLDEPIFDDRGPRSFGEEGIKKLHHEINPSYDSRTLVGRKKSDFAKLKKKEMARARNLRRIESLSSTYRERRMREMMDMTRVYSTNLSIDYPLIENKIRYVYRKFEKEKGLLKGRVKEAFAAAMLMGAAKSSGFYLTFDQLVDASKPVDYDNDMWKKEIVRSWKVLRYESDVMSEEFVGNADPANNIYDWCSKLDLENEIGVKAVKLYRESMEKIKKNPSIIHVGKPNGMVAGALYVSANQNGQETTQKRVAELAGISPVTLRRYSDAISSINGEKMGRVGNGKK